MNEFFVTLLNMSFKAGLVIVMVIALRFIFNKIPKWIHCLLWGLVAIRLLVPTTISTEISVFNILNNHRTIESTGEYFSYNEKTEKPKVEFEIPVIAQNEQSNNSSIEVQTRVSDFYIPAITFLWIIGMAGMLLYSVYSFIGIKKKVAMSIPIENNIYVCDDIDSSFILGMVRPKIFISSSMDKSSTENILEHEKAHIKRLDHIWKPLAFTLLSLHWFNPLMWVAYILLCKDIELACDEKVIKDMDKEQVALYSNTLLECSISKRMIAACPVAFGETAVKSRVKSALSYKKPAVFAVISALIICSFVAVFFMTDSVRAKEPEKLPAELKEVSESISVASQAEVAESDSNSDTVKASEPESDEETDSLLSTVIATATQNWNNLGLSYAPMGTEDFPEYEEGSSPYWTSEVKDDVVSVIYAAPKDTPLYAVESGVATNGFNPEEGNYLEIRTSSIYIRYTHLNQFVKESDSPYNVTAGDVIAYVGASGFVTGPCVRINVGQIQ